MNIKIISSSIREGRQSHHVVLYIKQWISGNTSHQSSILDLKALDFPLFHERLKFLENPDQQVLQFAQEIATTDAIFMVTPEYNGGIPASLKNIIDLLYEEWQNKPLTLAPVSSGIFAGTQVTKDLAFMMYRIGAYVTKGRFHVGNVQEMFDSEGKVLANQEFYHKIMQGCMGELEKFASLNQST